MAAVLAALGSSVDALGRRPTALVVGRLPQVPFAALRLLTEVNCHMR
jgi:hypothetical protein